MDWIDSGVSVAVAVSIGIGSGENKYRIGFRVVIFIERCKSVNPTAQRTLSIYLFMLNYSAGRHGS